jgi:predicted amidohydrolase YtcJ
MDLYLPPMYRLVFLGFLAFFQCKVDQKADLILFNGVIYTANESNQVVNSMAIKDGWILETGDQDHIMKFKSEQTQMMDLSGQFVMPGLIEGHGHFLKLGKNLIDIDLIQTKSWKEIIEKVQETIQNTPQGDWIEGRGWHQEKWTESPGLSVFSYPYHDDLSSISPNHPVVLTHASGHALMANKKAMDLAGISSETNAPSGGRIVKDAHGKLTGVFEENAMGLILNPLHKYYEEIPDAQKLEKLQKQATLASAECLKYGITSFQDAASSLDEIMLQKKWCEEGIIKPRMYVMLYNGFEQLMKEIESLPIADGNKYRFTSHAVKAFADGALGSYGAWLLQEYADQKHHFGQNTMPMEALEILAKKCHEKGLQLCVHGIGDRGNREILNVFEKILRKDTAHDLRWRIEHAQHLDIADIPRFKELGVIASIQAVHCTSDAPFVIKRLGVERARLGAYAWRSLLDNGARIANGTDCPVESINPFECMYAAITRKRLDTELEFFPEQKLTRLEALRSYTIWNAYAAKEEKIKGSLEKNKLADFIILDRNLLNCSDAELVSAKVTKVYISGVETHL